MNAKIVIVDDEAGIRQLVRTFLERHHFQVLEADSGKALSQLLSQEEVDLIILDLMLPDVHGIDICKELRTQSQVPIIMLTASQGEVNTILGFEAGADDYIEKPFSAHVLLSRIKAIIRRTHNGDLNRWKAPGNDAEQPQPVIKTHASFKQAEFASWTYHQEDACLSHNSGKKNFLTKNEALLLELLLLEKEPVNRDAIAHALGLNNDDVESRAIDVQVSRLRQKLKDRSNINFIQSIRNQGYQLTVPASLK